MKLSSKGPIIFEQSRVGLCGRNFIMYKFKTQENNFCVSPLAGFLRKTYIDELPQLWNVLRGDMSLVGPRPHIPQQVENYQPWQRRRLSVKPGITGPRQIKNTGRQMNFNERIELDFEYIDNCSVWLDIQIFIKTVLFLASRAFVRLQDENTEHE